MRIAIAMSGGVDSSVTAHLIRKLGHQVFGITMKLNPSKKNDAVEQAKLAADHLGIEHHVIDCRGDFERTVLRKCWDEYASGRTPNPCMICNPTIKFGLLYDQSHKLGATHLATGHHARLVRGPSGTSLHRGEDRAKDQSYFLARLDQEQLDRAFFPVGEMTKGQVRKIARDQDLPSAESEESQDTCIALSLTATSREGAFAETLRQKFDAPRPVGHLVDKEGGILGDHNGIHLFTRGQRRGLGISLGKRAFVSEIRPGKNEVVITTDPQDLLTTVFHATDFQWHGPVQGEKPSQCEVQIRYRHRPVPARIVPIDDDLLRIELEQPVSAVTKGQGAVLYDGDRVLGSGWIG